MYNSALYFGIETSPEKSETMEFLGHEQVRCEIIVDNGCLQQVKKINISVVKFPMKTKKLLKNNSQNLFQN